jgi:hypothetical protein
MISFNSAEIIQGDSGGKASISGRNNICHSDEKQFM